MKELKPCPFCDDVPDYCLAPDGVEELPYPVYHKVSNDCPLSNRSFQLERWNTRATTPEAHPIETDVNTLAREIAQIGMGYDFKGGGFRLDKRYIRIAEYLIKTYGTPDCDE